MIIHEHEEPESHNELPATIKRKAIGIIEDEIILIEREGVSLERLRSKHLLGTLDNFISLKFRYDFTPVEGWGDDDLEVLAENGQLSEEEIMDILFTWTEKLMQYESN